jgi:carboxypeptidase family protein
MNVPDTANAGPYTVTVTATYGTHSDQRQVPLQVEAFAPSLTVAMSQGSFAYPGDTVTVSGSGWAPNKPVTLDYNVPGVSDTSVTADGSGAFTAPSITVPDHTEEGSYSVKASESPNLEQTASVTVAWRQLLLTFDLPASTQQGSNITISGTVTDKDGKPVEGAIVSFDTGGLQSASPATTDGSGKFTSSVAVPDDAAAQQYTISATGQKTPGYKSANADRGLQVTIRPTPLGTIAGEAAIGAAAGTGVVATATLQKDTSTSETSDNAGSETDGETKKTGGEGEEDKTKEYREDTLDKAWDKSREKTVEQLEETISKLPDNELRDKLENELKTVKNIEEFKKAADKIKELIETAKKAKEVADAFNQNLQQTKNLDVSPQIRKLLAASRAVPKAAGMIAQTAVDKSAESVTGGLKVVEDEGLHKILPIEEFGDEVGKAPTSTVINVLKALGRDQVSLDEVTGW